MALARGDAAPDFNLPSTSGEISLASLRGQKVVLYFYPKDDTPGCTRESCDFRDGHGAALAAGAVVLGVSKDSLASHERFRAKYSLPFPLLSDSDNAVAKAYGAYGTKIMYGKEVLGTIRSTYVIDEKGKIAAAWSPVKVDGHAAQVLEALGAKTPASLLAPRADAAPKSAKKATAPKAPAKKPAAPKAAAKKPAAKPAAKAAKKGASRKK